MLDHDEISYARFCSRHADRDARLAKTGIPARFWGMTLSDLDPPTPELEPLDEAISRFVGEYTPQTWRGMRAPLLQGPAGIGKTTYACVAAVMLSDRGFTVRFITLQAFLDLRYQRMDLQRAGLGPEVATEYASLRRREDDIRQVAQLLVLDDVGKELESTYNRTLVDALFRGRWDDATATLPTTNLGLSEWGERYGEPMGSFIHECCDPVRIKVADPQRADRRVRA